MVISHNSNVKVVKNSISPDKSPSGQTRRSRRAQARHNQPWAGIFRTLVQQKKA